MKINRIPVMSMVLLGTWLLAPRPVVAAQGTLTFLIAPPAAAFDFSNLDLRDENNRPIRSLSARWEMERLFTSSLYNSLFQNLTPSRRELLALLNHVSSTASSCARVLRRFFDRVLALVPRERWARPLMSAFMSGFYLPQPSWRKIGFAGTGGRFVFLISFILSSTTLLR